MNEDKRLVQVGNYRLTGRLLGKGHFGKVMEAVHNVLNVRVALKIINTKDIRDRYLRKNLRREARILAKVSHPGVVCLYETMETETNYYLALEIGDGGDLCQFVKSQKAGKVPETKARLLARQLVSAIKHLHERGVIHRDLKMENILLDRQHERIMLIDFGLSNTFSPNSFLKTHCGSPEYAAPELYMGVVNYGPEVDIWSLGVVFFAMVFGQLPFKPFQKPNATHDERHKYFLEETKRGLVTTRHKHLLNTCTNLFKNMVLKMLNPVQKERIGVVELENHIWIFGAYQPELPRVSKEWQRQAFDELGVKCSMSALTVFETVRQSPYGRLGGMYNIKMRHEQLQMIGESLDVDQLQKKKNYKNRLLRETPSKSRQSRTTSQLQLIISQLSVTPTVKAYFGDPKRDDDQCSVRSARRPKTSIQKKTSETKAPWNGMLSHQQGRPSLQLQLKDLRLKGVQSETATQAIKTGRRNVRSMSKKTGPKSPKAVVAKKTSDKRLGHSKSSEERRQMFRKPRFPRLAADLFRVKVFPTRLTKRLYSNPKKSS